MEITKDELIRLCTGFFVDGYNCGLSDGHPMTYCAGDKEAFVRTYFNGPEHGGRQLFADPISVDYILDSITGFPVPKELTTPQHNA